MMSRNAVRIWENQYECLKKVPTKKLQAELALAMLDYAFSGKHDAQKFPLDAIIQPMYAALVVKNQGGAPAGNNNRKSTLDTTVDITVNTTPAQGEDIYRTIKDIIDNIRASWKEPEISDMKGFCSCPLLIIDEIGVQYGTDGERNELYTVFNRRYEDMLPIMAISNNSLTELQNILGQRIYDRLIDGALIFELNGRSHRKT